MYLNNNIIEVNPIRDKKNWCSEPLGFMLP